MTSWNHVTFVDIMEIITCKSVETAK